MILSSKQNNKALENLNDKFLELMNHKGIIAPYSFSSLSKITNLEHTSQFKLVKDPDSKRANGFLINKIIPVTICNN